MGGEAGGCGAGRDRSPDGPSSSGTLAVVLLLAGFATLGILRLNPFCLFEPDSADYLFTSRALVSLEGYREIDHPARPPHAFRPPGLPVLLASVTWTGVNRVIAAKAMLLGVAVAMLWLVAAHTATIAGRWPATAVLAVVASSPYTLLHATEVLSEVPYVACCVGALLLLATGNDGRGRVIPAGLVLCALPFFRTVGLSLVVAVVFVAAARRSWRWLASGGIALLPSLLWSWRNGRVGGPTYIGNVLHDLSALGVAGLARKAVDTSVYYAHRLADVFLPGLGPGDPVYGKTMFGGAPDLGLPAAGATAMALGLAVVALAGMLARRRREGGVAAVYVLLYLAGLAVYPPRHERLVWPLVPILWIYVPEGLRLLGVRLAPTVARAVRGAALLLAGLVVAWQGASSVLMVTPNLRWKGDHDRFYAESIPPFYYADWPAAGRWLRANSPGHARVLTRHSDLGLEARRWQNAVRFEEVSPAEWRSRIASFRARYLAVPTTRFDRLFDRGLLHGDPAYVFEPVYEAKDVLVLEVKPNRSGTVRLERPSPVESLAACRLAAERQPDRTDLTRRLAELLVEAGRADEAEQSLRQAIDRRGDDTALHLSLGEVLLARGRFEEALDRFERARGLPDAGGFAGALERGIRKAREGSRLRALPAADRARELVDEARWRLRILDPPGAWEAASEAVELAPRDPDARLVYAEVLQRAGRTDEAEEAFRVAARGGRSEAARKLTLLSAVRQLEGDSAAALQDRLRLAAAYARDGTPGRALALLERGLERFPESVEIKLRLADLFLFYGMAEKSEPLYREVLTVRPGDSTASRGLRASAQLLEAPAF